MCSDDTVEELVSPDHEMKAVIYCRDCGATTSFSTHVEIIPRSKTFFSSNGHIFAADASRVKAQRFSCGGPKVEALWKDNDTLIIRYDRNSKIHKSLDEFKNVNIIYVAN